MNKHLHRIIFNPARGMRMVVQETAVSVGQGASRGTPRVVRGSAATVVLLGVLVGGVAHAQIVGAPNVPGNLRPTVLVAPNGVPLVNIQAPSAAGVSRNVYSQFDVMGNGAILNNSRVNAQTQLGGFVQGNPWLARGAARVILNEVNSGNPTQLRGYVEVGGPRAEVIIANPAGISVNGGGFINASRATLTTGVPQLNAAGGLEGFLVRNGSVGIEGTGLDASKTDYAAILSRAVQVNAGIWANELKVVTGANHVSTDHGSVTPSAGTRPAPAFALDVAALGGMYARKITLIGTETGLGVRNAGNVGTGTGGLVVTVQGRLENTGTLEGPRVQLNSGADIDNRAGTIRQTGMAGLTVDSPVLGNTNGGVIGAEPLTPATGVGGAAIGSGTSAAPATPDPSIQGAEAADRGASPTPAHVPAAPGTINAVGAILNDGGRIYAGGPVTLKTPQINNAGGTLNVATMAVTGSSFSNAGGTLNVSQSFGANVGRFDNAGGKLNAGSLQITTSDDLANVGGTLTSGSDASLAIGGNADNTRGTISAVGRLTADVMKAVSNGAGTLVANEGLTLGASALDNTKGSIQSVNAGAQLAVTNQLASTGGEIGAGTNLSVKAGALGTSGTIRASNDITLTVAGAFVNDGRITAGRDTTITVGSLASGSASALGAGVQNDGKPGSAGNLSVTASDMLAANGINVAAGNAMLQGASVDLSKSQTSAANISVTAKQGNVSTSDKAKVVTPGTIDITANARAGQTLVNDTGVLNAGRVDLKISNITNTRGGEIVQTGADAAALAVSGTLNNDGGRIAGNSHDLSLSAAMLRNAGGKIEHAGAGTLRMAGGSYSGVGGQIAGNGALVVDVSNGFTQDNGRTDARQITIDAGSLSNRGGKVFGTSLSVDTRGGELDNSAKGTMAAMGAVVLRSGALNNDTGLIQSGDSLHIDTNGQVLTNTNAAGYRTQPADPTGGIASGGRLTLKTGDVKNVAGSIGSKGALTADTQVFTNTDGVLMGGQPAALGADGKMRSGTGGVFLSAKSFSGDGQIISANDLGIALVQDVTNNASIVVGGNLSYVTAGKLTNNTKLRAGGTLTVGGGSVDNNAGAEMSGGDSIVNAATALTNRGLIDSQGSTQIDSGALNNVGTGRIYGNAVSVAAGTLDNYAETVGGVTSAGTIAARETLNIGAGTVSNREHALIFSGGVGTKAMSIGGKLDGNREATTSGGVLNNLSARIESLGGMTISMGQIANLDTHIKLGPQTTTRQFSRTIGVEGIGHFKPEDVAYTPGKPNLAIRNPDGTWRPANGHVWGLWDKTVLTTTDTAIDADPAAIVAGSDMTLNGGGLNRDSKITAGGVLTAPGIRNEALQGQVTTQTASIVHWRATKREPDIIEPVSRVSKDVGAYEKTGGLNATQGYDAGKAASGANGGNRNVTIVEVPANVGAVVKADSRSSPGAGVSKTVPMVVRTSTPRTDIPRASLFSLNGGPQGYLVETDPRFANYRSWLSSDYLLSGLGLDPNNMLKRLGDGFYEQKLVREQVAQLTGYRYLGGHYSDEEQYTALMNNGATFARQYGLRPGIGLSQAQMAQLTSDIVWLVEQTVTLPDGSFRNVLAPQLYVRVRHGDVDGSGALLSADATFIEGDGDLVNTGTIAGRTLVRIDKDNVSNLGGRIAGADLAIHARTDLNNIGGSITAGDSATLTAGRDINIETTTRTQGGALASRTNIDRVAGVYVGNPGGTLAASAGRDVRLAGAIVANTGTDSKTLLKARRDISISTVKEEEHQERATSPRNFHSQSSSREVGSQIVGGGDVSLDAGRDIHIRGSAIDAEGDLAVKSREGDVRIETGRATAAVDSASETRKRGFLSSKTTTQRDSQREDMAIGSTLGGRNIVVSGQDVTVSGSEVIADKNTAIVAKRNLSIEADRNTHSDSSYQGTAQSGLMGSGGFGFTIGSRSQSTDTRSGRTTAARSTVGSIGGNTTLIAGNQYTQIGSDVVASDGDVTIAAKKIAIREARETSRSETEQKQKSGGMTIALTAPVVSAVQSIGSTAKAMKNTGSGRMQALGAASIAAEAKGVADAMANANVTNPAQSMGVNLSISLGGSQNKSNRTETSDTAAGSRVEGKNVTMLALGGGKESNILVQGSDIVARDSATLVADNRIDILAAQSTSERHGTNQGSGGSVGVSFGTSGLLFNVGANGSKGKSDGSDTSYTNSHVSAGNRVSLASGGDTTIRGGVIEADRVSAKVGGDLKIESLQDTSTSSSRQQSVGGSLSVGVGVWSVGVSASSAKAGGNYASVREQSGIKAGDGGFDVDVKGRTELKGAVIESTQAAVDSAKNTFKSAGLITSDIQNIDTYKASGASLGVSVSGQQPKGEDKKHIPGSAFKVGSGGSAGVGSASGQQVSVTRAGISGIAADQSVRTGVDGTNALVKKWDAEKLVGDVQAQVQITQTAAPKAVKAVGEYADRQTLKYERAQLQASVAQQVLNDPTAGDDRRAQAKTDLADANTVLAAEQQNYDNWKEGGASRVLAHVVVGGLTGNAQGAAGAAVASDAAPTIEDLTRNLPEGVKGAVGAGLAAALGAVGGAAGAATALNADVNNRQSNAAQRDALIRLQQSKGEVDRKKLADAMCAILKCAAGADPNSAGYAALVSSQNRGADYKAEQQLLLKTGVFSDYGWSDGAIDIASTLLHNAKDGVQGAASGAGYLGNAVAQDFKNAVASANPPDIPPDVDTGGKPPTAGGSAVVVGAMPTVLCAAPPFCVPGLAPVVSGGRLGYAPGNATLSSSNEESGSLPSNANTSNQSSGALANLLGKERELKVAEISGGKISNEKIITGRGHTDVDVIGPNGELIGVGGPAKSNKLSNLGGEIAKLKEEAAKRGVIVQYYITDSTPRSVYEFLAKRLGVENVFIFKEP